MEAAEAPPARFSNGWKKSTPAQLSAGHFFKNASERISRRVLIIGSASAPDETARLQFLQMMCQRGGWNTGFFVKISKRERAAGQCLDDQNPPRMCKGGCLTDDDRMGHLFFTAVAQSVQQRLGVFYFCIGLRAIQHPQAETSGRNQAAGIKRTKLIAGILFRNSCQMGQIRDAEALILEKSPEKAEPGFAGKDATGPPEGWTKFTHYGVLLHYQYL